MRVVGSEEMETSRSRAEGGSGQAGGAGGTAGQAGRGAALAGWGGSISLLPLRPTGRRGARRSDGEIGEMSVDPVWHSDHVAMINVLDLLEIPTSTQQSTPSDYPHRLHPIYHLIHHCATPPHPFSSILADLSLSLLTPLPLPPSCRQTPRTISSATRLPAAPPPASPRPRRPQLRRTPTTPTPTTS